MDRACTDDYTEHRFSSRGCLQHACNLIFGKLTAVKWNRRWSQCQWQNLQWRDLNPQSIKIPVWQHPTAKVTRLSLADFMHDCYTVLPRSVHNLSCFHVMQTTLITQTSFVSLPTLNNTLNRNCWLSLHLYQDYLFSTLKLHRQ